MNLVDREQKSKASALSTALPGARIVAGARVANSLNVTKRMYKAQVGLREWDL